MKAAFTWGKSLDNNSATIAGDAFGNSVPSFDWYDTSLSYGRSDDHAVVRSQSRLNNSQPVANLAYHDLVRRDNSVWRDGHDYMQRLVRQDRLESASASAG